MTMTSAKSHESSRSRSHGPNILHWLFTRGHHVLSCDVRVAGRQRYELHVTPLWDREGPAVEVFSGPTAALRRHAEIAFFLRESGWMLADRSVMRSAA
jgi:hypothetical protein